jgi:hypothetical protein
MIYGLVASQVTIQTLQHGLCVDSAIGVVAYCGFMGCLSFDDIPLFDAVCRVFLRIMDERFLIPHSPLVFIAICKWMQAV